MEIGIKMSKVYVVVMIEADLKQMKDETYAVEPLGVYSSSQKALDYINELEKVNPISERYETVFDIFEFDMDKEPLMLKWMAKQKEIKERTIQDAVVDLMKEGMIDQLIGEDGHFYYVLTDLGKKSFDEMRKGVPEQIKKFLRKNQEED